MGIVSWITSLPILVQIVGGVIISLLVFGLMLALAIRFRLIVALTVAAVIAYGQWGSDDSSIVLPVAIGFVVWFILRVLDVSDEVSASEDWNLEQESSRSSGGYDHRAEANRIEADYHRRQRETLFR